MRNGVERLFKIDKHYSDYQLIVEGHSPVFSRFNQQKFRGVAFFVCLLVFITELVFFQVVIYSRCSTGLHNFSRNAKD